MINPNPIEKYIKEFPVRTAKSVQNAQVQKQPQEQ